MGATCTRALEPEAVIPNEDGRPYLFQTILDWCVVGPVTGNNTEKVTFNRRTVTKVCTRDTTGHHF